jgi:hypothetical protein
MVLIYLLETPEMPQYHQGFYKPRNPHKYKGDPTNVVYRSRWELLVMDRLDRDPNVIWWQSEETVIPYRSPVDNRIHRYFIDFTARTQTPSGTKTILIEVKPFAQTQPPVLTESKRKTKKYINEVMRWGVNSAKWKAAKEYCKDRGYEFMIMTEKELGIKF